MVQRGEHANRYTIDAIGAQRTMSEILEKMFDYIYLILVIVV
jgi:hypothetical protein